MTWTVILKNGKKWCFQGPYDTEPTIRLLEQQGVPRGDVAALIKGDMVSRTAIPA
jgi:hypothetical protein